MYIGYEFREINLGDKFIVTQPNYGRTKYSRPLEVIKITRSQFTLEPLVPEDEQTEDTPKAFAEPIRFLRTSGKRVGDGERIRAWRAQRATDRLIKEIEEITAKEKKAENEAAAKARAEETALREKYGATGITDEVVQKKYLAPLRSIAEQSEKTIAYYMKEFENAELRPENLKRFARRLDRAVEGGEIFIALELQDMVKEVNDQLIEMLERFYKGTRFEIGGATTPLVQKELNSGEALAKAFLTYQLERETSRFFNFGITGADAGVLARHKWISELRTIVGVQYMYERVKEIKENDDA